ncbi:hypothetical protein [Coleofasciculus chthonoplastes]|uniref:hypothetical protein n=1 Tax=Coleofasciculus chthonoplastes TaxID=64178 RepID=UPI0032F876A7
MASIDLIDWDYREGAGDTRFIRMVVGCEEILLDADGIDAEILHESTFQSVLKGFSENLTKREQFAAIALQSLLATGAHRLSPAEAVWMADALIAKLEAK